MNIKSHLEQTVKNLEAEREKEVAVIREKVTREKIIPYNQEADKGRDLAIAELQQNLNEDIALLQAKFAKEKQAIFEENEKRKENNATSVISTETCTVTIKYDKEISYLKERISELKD